MPSALLRATVRILLASHCIQNVRLVHHVVVALFRLDRLIFILQRFVQIDLVGQEISGRIVPAFPVILVEPVQLPVNAGSHQVVHVDLQL